MNCPLPRETLAEDLGQGEWGAPHLGSLLKAAIAGNTFDAYQFDLVRSGKETRNLVLSVHRLEDGTDASTTV